MWRAGLLVRRRSSMATSRMPARTPSARRTTVRDFCVARSDTQSWTSERRIDQISLSAQTGATWLLPRLLERHVVRGLRHWRLLGTQPAIGEHSDRNPRRRWVDVLALRLRHRDHGEVQLRLAHRREAALLRLGVIRLSVAHTVAAPVHRFVRGDGAHLDLRSCRLDGQYRASVGHRGVASTAPKRDAGRWRRTSPMPMWPRRCRTARSTSTADCSEPSPGPVVGARMAPVSVRAVPSSVLNRPDQVGCGRPWLRGRRHRTGAEGAKGACSNITNLLTRRNGDQGRVTSGSRK